MNFLSVLDRCDDTTKRNVMNMRANQRREYLLSVSNLVGLSFWSEKDDLALDAIDKRLAEVVERAQQAPSIEKLAATMAEPHVELPSFLHVTIDNNNPDAKVTAETRNVRG